MQKLLRSVEKLTDEMIAIRRRIHENPEVGLCEHETAALISERLTEAGIDHRTGVGGTGIVAVVRGAKRGKCIGLRGDMDALLIQEETGLEFASKNPGVMHACGHDSHVAMVLGAGLALHECRQSLRGSVKLLFQQAEETVGGAPLMIADGALEKPKMDAAVAVHAWKDPVGMVSLRYGEHLAAADGVQITVKGKGGHGAMPEVAADPVLASANVIVALQQIVSRRVSPVQPAVVSICRIEGGTSYNIIPSDVKLAGTIRTFGGEVQDLVEAEVKRVAKAAAKTYACAALVKYTRSCPALIHDEALTRLTEEACRELLGDENVDIAPTPCMGAEDFAFFAQEVPATQIAVGMTTPGGAAPLFHHPEFAIDERGIPVGAKALAATAWRFLNGR